jgi:rRNA maturation RNase YbeY
VITFDYSDKTVGADLRRLLNQKRGETPYVGSHKKIQGEVYICMDETVLQARKFGTSWQTETVRYVVHGILHLLGHDDLCASARRIMKREENRLLRKLSRRFALSKL